MSANSSIEWTDRTWNPVRGCSVISPGCVNCYAMKMAHRFSGAGKPYEGLTKQTKAGPQWTGKVAFVNKQLLDPIRWKEPGRVFVNSMSDLFHESIPDDWIDRVMLVMALAPRHTFQVLTKRAERMQRYLSDGTLPGRLNEYLKSFANLLELPSAAYNNAGAGPEIKHWPKTGPVLPLPNVWIGVSVENQKYADERIPMLLDTPAAVRFVSAEPLLGPIDFTLRGSRVAGWDEDWRYNVLSGEEWAGPRDDNPEQSQHLDWVIVGGESGNGARPFDTTFARSIVKQCADGGVACFVKQMGAKPEQPSPGAWHTAHREPMALVDRKGGDMAEWPADLRVRQFPTVMNHA
jgi:protein gp37